MTVKPGNKKRVNASYRRRLRRRDTRSNVSSLSPSASGTKVSSGLIPFVSRQRLGTDNDDNLYWIRPDPLFPTHVYWMGSYLYFEMCLQLSRCLLQT